MGWLARLFGRGKQQAPPPEPPRKQEPSSLEDTEKFRPYSPFPNVGPRCGLCGYVGGSEEVKSVGPWIDKDGNLVAANWAQCTDGQSCLARLRDKIRQMEPDLDQLERIAAFKARINYIPPAPKSRSRKPWW